MQQAQSWTIDEELVESARGIRQSSIRAVTRRIEAVKGINLGQGTCDLPPNPEITAAARKALEKFNSYTLFDGISSLKEAIVNRYSAYNKLTIKTENVLVTCGATGGLECVCKCFLKPGREVLLFEPIYQYHVELVKERGGIPKFIPLRPPNWDFDPEVLEASITPGVTKLLVFANPNNPCGKVFTRDELKLIGEICKKYKVIPVVDEVYEYILGPEVEHVSLASMPGMFDYTITLSSASKTLFVTGWRVGWVVGPESIMGSLGVKSDQTYICAPAPLQHAVADGLNLGDTFFNHIKAPFIRRREKVCSALRQAGLKPYEPAGAYYILANYTALGYTSDEEAMNGLIDRVGIGSIPGKSFFNGGADSGLLRFCFALDDHLIDRACELLTSRPLGKEQ